MGCNSLLPRGNPRSRTAKRRWLADGLFPLFVSKSRGESDAYNTHPLICYDYSVVPIKRISKYPRCFGYFKRINKNYIYTVIIFKFKFDDCLLLNFWHKSFGFTTYGTYRNILRIEKLSTPELNWPALFSATPLEKSEIHTLCTEPIRTYTIRLATALTGTPQKSGTTPKPGEKPARRGGRTEGKTNIGRGPKTALTAAADGRRRSVVARTRRRLHQPGRSGRILTNDHSKTRPVDGPGGPRVLLVAARLSNVRRRNKHTVVLSTRQTP